jgi:hypothetical protein
VVFKIVANTVYHRLGERIGEVDCSIVETVWAQTLVGLLFVAGEVVACEQSCAHTLSRPRIEFMG